MDGFFWPAIGLATGGLALLLYLRGLMRRRWSAAGLYVATGCLAVALVNMVAPFRGTLDPDYVGYSFGLIALPRGPAVGLVAGSFYLAAIASIVLALDRARGPRMWLVTALNAVVLVALGGYLVGGLAGIVPPFRLELGEYLHIPALPATTIALAVLVLPFMVGLFWSASRARADVAGEPAGQA